MNPDEELDQKAKQENVSLNYHSIKSLLHLFDKRLLSEMYGLLWSLSTPGVYSVSY